MRPIRFATGAATTSDPAKLLAAAQRAEALGYSTFVMPDHFMMPFAPLIALQAIADATTTLRLGQLVLAQDFRHPAVLAKELASLDVFSGGRVEVGIGAGWIRAEFEQAGIPFDKPSVRIERLEEALIVLKGLFGDGTFTFTGTHFSITELDGTPKPVQRPGPPLLVGGGGPKVLAAAARQADIIQVLPRPNGDAPSRGLDLSAIGRQAFEERIELVRSAAGERFAAIELGSMLMTLSVTDEPERVADEFLARLGAPDGDAAEERRSREAFLSSPMVAIGSLEQVCDKLLETRDTLGISYFTGPVGTRADTLGPVIERLAGA